MRTVYYELDYSIDIETLDRTPTAVVLTLGLNVEDWKKEWTFDLAQQEKLGRTVNLDVVLWHYETHPEQFKSMLDRGLNGDDKMSVQTVLNELSYIVQNVYDVMKIRKRAELEQTLGDFNLEIVSSFWMNSPSFDHVILENLASRVDLDLPWTFRDCQDYRTLKRRAKLWNPEAFMPPPPSNAHVAIVDACYQRDMIRHFKTILEGEKL